MKNLTIKISVCFLLITAFVILSRQSVTAQITLGEDSAVKGSAPYEEAVRNFLDNKEAKIVGGKQAEIGAFPWQVSLGVSWIADPYYAHFCGGSVYSSKWIVTASHCVENLTPGKVVITAGTNRLVSGATRRNVRRIIVHKSYNTASYDNDIALIELFGELPLGDTITAVPLLTSDAESASLNDAARLIVTGWGATQEGGKTVRDLRFLDNMPAVDRTSCNRPLAYDGKITENMFCAGFVSGGGDSCQGDSGGPLIVNIENVPTLAGVVSWGEGCARANKVGVYTRVPKFTEWVNECVTGSNKCNK